MELLQIVPMLPPAISGVGDYALLLARELQASHGVQTRFLCGDTGWREQEKVAPFQGEAVTDRSVPSLLKALEKAASCRAVLLHYVGHGYERRGCPLWLVRALEQWKCQNEEMRMIVLFHELYAFGPVWSSAFWTLPLQKSLVRRLGRTGDLFLTPTGIVGQLLRPFLSDQQHREIKVLPVFSTIGELASVPPTARRQRQMVVFGSRQWRMRAYTQHASSLLNACRSMGIERIIDVGPDAGTLPTPSIPIDVRGALPAAEASALFAESLAGFFAYPVIVLGKSTIFAAYAAHGMVPVTFTGNAPHPEDGLREGEHYLTDEDGSLVSPQRVAEIAASAASWYSGHDCKSLARQIAQQLERLFAL